MQAILLVAIYPASLPAYSHVHDSLTELAEVWMI